MPRTTVTALRRTPQYMGGSTVFNGSTSQVVVTHNSSYTFAKKLTVSCWVKTHGFQSDAEILSKGLGTAFPFAIRHYNSDGTVRFTTYDGTNNPQAIHTTKLTPNTWYHLVGSTDGTTLKFYINNNVVTATDNTTSTDNALDITFGNRTSSTKWFNGKIADVRIFSSALTASQVASLYQTGISPIAPVGQWALDDQPSTYVDKAGGNNGTGTATTYSPDTPTTQRKSVRDDKASLKFLAAPATNKVVVTNPTSCNFGANQDFTLYAELNVAQIASAASILNKGATVSPNAGYRWTYSNANGAWGLSLGDGSTRPTFTISPIAREVNNTWIKATMVVSRSGTAKQYVNGKLIGTVDVSSMAASSLTTTADLNIGDIGNVGWWDGGIKNVRIWSTALSQQQVQDLHVINVVPRTSIVGEWLFNEGAGTTAYDTSGNGNNGTITGATWSSDTPSKARKTVGGNLVPNGDFSYTPPFTAATTAGNVWVNGTTAGGTTGIQNNIFGWYQNGGGTYSGQFDTTNLSPLGTPSIKLSTLAVASYNQIWGSSLTDFSTNGVRVLPSTSYNYSFWMKTNYVSGDSNHGANIAWLVSSGAGASDATTNTTLIKTTTGWTQYTGTFTTTATARFLTPRLTLYGHTGTATLIMDAWFANITLTPTTNTIRIASPST